MMYDETVEMLFRLSAEKLPDDPVMLRSHAEELREGLAALSAHVRGDRKESGGDLAEALWPAVSEALAATGTVRASVTIRSVAVHLQQQGPVYVDVRLESR